MGAMMGGAQQSSPGMFGGLMQMLGLGGGQPPQRPMVSDVTPQDMMPQGQAAPPPGAQPMQMPSQQQMPEEIIRMALELMRAGRMDENGNMTGGTPGFNPQAPMANGTLGGLMGGRRY